MDGLTASKQGPSAIGGVLRQVSRADSPTARDQTALLHGTKSPVVLVVDDDREQVRQIASFLTHRGILTIGETDGGAAIQTIQRTAPMVVIMDVNMPELNGIETARLIAALPETPKIILMSGETDWIVEANSAGLDVFAVVDKPIPLRAVELFVRKAIKAF